MNGLALCAGAGGLELGLSLALGDSYRTVVFIERDAYAAATLVARMEDKALDAAPIWDDIGTFDGEPWRGVVDIVSGGFPCQPWSAAGEHRGVEDERWLWDDIARTIREIGPRWVFLENVPPLILGGIEHVLRDLAQMGFDAEWGLFRADSFGAPHRRERLFILAHAKSNASWPNAIPNEGMGHTASERREKQGERPILDGAFGARSTERVLAHATSGSGQPPRADNGIGSPDLVGNRGSSLACSAGQRRQGPIDTEPYVAEHRPGVDGGQPVGQDQDQQLAPFPPGPTALQLWGGVPPTLKPAVCGVVDGLAYRVDRLHTIGNGVVPIVAAHAFCALASRAGFRIA